MLDSNIASERNSPTEWLPPWTRREHQARYEFAAQFMTGKTVVDCACGDGMGAETFLRENPLQFYGFDVDSESVEIATQKLARSNACFKQADALSLPLENGCADLFISLETIEHINDDGGFVSEIARVLKPNGKLILSTPNRLVTNPGKTIHDAPWNQYHVREYAVSDLNNLLARHFVIEGWYGQNPVSIIKVEVMKRIAAAFGKMFAVRINQLWKCRWFIDQNPRHHAVSEVSELFEYEYLIAVCALQTQGENRRGSNAADNIHRND